MNDSPEADQQPLFEQRGAWLTLQTTQERNPAFWNDFRLCYPQIREGLLQNRENTAANDIRTEALSLLYLALTQLATFGTNEKSLLKSGPEFSLPPVATEFLISDGIITDPNTREQVQIAASSRGQRGKPPPENILTLECLSDDEAQKILNPARIVGSSEPDASKERFLLEGPFFYLAERYVIIHPQESDFACDIVNHFLLGYDRQTREINCLLIEQHFEPHVHALVNNKWIRIDASDAARRGINIPREFYPLSPDLALPAAATNDQIAALLCLIRHAGEELTPAPPPPATEEDFSI